MYTNKEATEHQCDQAQEAVRHKISWLAMLNECNEITGNCQHMMTDHEESFLKDFFTHVASLSFDKAKELVVSDFSMR